MKAGGLPGFVVVSALGNDAIQFSWKLIWRDELSEFLLTTVSTGPHFFMLELLLGLCWLLTNIKTYYSELTDVTLERSLIIL